MEEEITIGSRMLLVFLRLMIFALIAILAAIPICAALDFMGVI